MVASHPETCAKGSRFGTHKVLMNALDWLASWSMWLSWALWFVTVEGDEEGFGLSGAIVCCRVAPVIEYVGASIEPGDSFVGLGSRHRPYCWARLQTFQRWYVLLILDETNNHKIIVWYINIFQWVISVSPWLKCLILPSLIIVLIILVRIMLHIRRLLAAFCTVSIHTVEILI